MKTNHGERTLTLLGTKGGPALRTPGVSFLPTSNLLCLGQRKIIIDCGIGVTQALVRAGHSASAITDIFITHLHSDHVLELGGLIHTAWTSGLQHLLVVRGPVGTARVWSHFLQMMEVDIAVRVLDEGRPHLRDLVSVYEYDQGTVEENSDFTVSALRTIHPPMQNCFALNFVFEGQKICFSGDTAYMPSLAGFAENARILVHEAMLQSGVEYVTAKTRNTDERLHRHLIASHSFAHEAGRIAHDARVELLVLSHLIPAERIIAKDDDWIAEVRLHFSGNVMVGVDGMKIPV
jgi:ribonuclease BN (tRNA processing enzyme)